MTHSFCAVHHYSLVIVLGETPGDDKPQGQGLQGLQGLQGQGEEEGRGRKPLVARVTGAVDKDTRSQGVFKPYYLLLKDNYSYRILFLANVISELGNWYDVIFHFYEGGGGTQGRLNQMAFLR